MFCSSRNRRVFHEWSELGSRPGSEFVSESLLLHYYHYGSHAVIGLYSV